MEGFWWLRTTFGVILFAFFTLFRFSKKIEKSMPKSMIFDCSEPRLALYSSLISHFCHFRKTSKNRCKKGCQKLSFLVPKPALAAQGPIDSAFFDDLGELEKSTFFGNRSGSQKNRKNCAKGRQKESRMPAGTYLLLSSWAPQAAPRARPEGK